MLSEAFFVKSLKRCWLETNLELDSRLLLVIGLKFSGRRAV